jgi:hypothetical protein
LGPGEVLVKEKTDRNLVTLFLDPFSHSPLCPLYLMALRLICPIKIGLICLRAIVIAALSLPIS